MTIFSVKIIFKKDDFWLLQKMTFTCFLNLRKIWQKITFTCFLNLRKIWTKKIFTKKIIFEKDDFQSVYFFFQINLQRILIKYIYIFSKFGQSNYYINTFYWYTCYKYTADVIDINLACNSTEKKKNLQNEKKLKK